MHAACAVERGHCAEGRQGSDGAAAERRRPEGVVRGDEGGSDAQDQRCGLNGWGAHTAAVFDTAAQG